MKTTRAPKSLRGSKLTELALRDLSDLSLWTDPNPPLTWANLATRVGVSRQAIERKPEIKKAYHAAKGDLDKYGEKHAKPENVVRRTFEQRIQSMNAAQAALTKKLNGWLEWWASIEYNARTLGVDLDRLLDHTGGGVRALSAWTADSPSPQSSPSGRGGHRPWGSWESGWEAVRVAPGEGQLTINKHFPHQPSQIARSISDGSEVLNDLRRRGIMEG